MLFILSSFFFISALGSAFAWNWGSFLLFRLIGGLGVGGASVVSPMYTAEISPAKYRGRLVAFVQFNIVLGILLAYFSNYIIGIFHLGEIEWRWMFGVEAVPALVFICLLFINPRSPRWLVAKGKIEEAANVLRECGTDTGSIEGDLKEIQVSLHTEHYSFKKLLFSKKYRIPILLAVAIAAFNQLSGINAILYYSKQIFEMAGYGSQSALLQSVIIGVTNLIFTMAAMTVIDVFGRKKLMIVGSIGYILSLSAATAAFYFKLRGVFILWALIVFIASHAFGQGAVIWVFISEIFPNRVRAQGQALGTFTHWFMCALISWTFPMIAAASGSYTFAFFAFCMVGQLIWVILIMPETKGVSLEGIQKMLNIK